MYKKLSAASIVLLALAMQDQILPSSAIQIQEEGFLSQQSVLTADRGKKKAVKVPKNKVQKKKAKKVKKAEETAATEA